MSRIIDPFIAELEQEVPTTRRVLERVPAGKSDWQPHPTSMPLGRLAFHVANIPGRMATYMKEDRVDIGRFGPDQVESIDKLVPTYETSIKTALNVFRGMDDAAMMRNWIVTKDGQVVFELPRIAFARALILNHWYHHRGQLTVFLRMLGVPIPSIYGPSGDDNPFA